MENHPSRPAFAQRRHWSLAVLALLRERPMHPYEMRRLMRLRHKDDRLVLKPGSLYNAVAWLLERELIETVGTAREGRRPQRTVYRILPAGERELATWIGTMITEVERDVSSFSVALDHIVQLPPGEAAGYLEARRGRLEAHIAALTETLRSRVAAAGRMNLLEVEHDLALFSAQREWLGGLVTDLREGTLRWDTARVLDNARASFAREAAP